MGISVCHYPEEARLDLTVEDNLNLTQTQPILDACKLVDERLRTCVIDCTRVVRVFDSGIALLDLLVRRLAKFGVRPIVIGAIPGLAIESIPEVAVHAGR